MPINKGMQSPPKHRPGTIGDCEDRSATIGDDKRRLDGCASKYSVLVPMVTQRRLRLGEGGVVKTKRRTKMRQILHTAGGKAGLRPQTIPQGWQRRQALQTATQKERKSKDATTQVLRRMVTFGFQPHTHAKVGSRYKSQASPPPSPSYVLSLFFSPSTPRLSTCQKKSLYFLFTPFLTRHPLFGRCSFVLPYLLPPPRLGLDQGGRP